MAKINLSKALDFKNISILPSFSDIKYPNLYNKFTNTNGFRSYRLPIIISPMDSVSSKNMIKESSELDILCAIHRYQSIDSVKESFIINVNNPVAVGSYESHKKVIHDLIDYGVRFFIIDVAHGGSRKAIDSIYAIKKIDSEIKIMSGSVCTYKDALACALAGADFIRVGVSPGNSCETRNLIGVGLPLPQSLIDISEPLKKDFPKIKIVGDGGISSSGDFIKSIALGADYAMIGTYFAGCFESPSKFYQKYESYFQISESYFEISENGLNQCEERGIPVFKKARGMASLSALVEGNGKNPNDVVIEGKEHFVPYRGKLKDVVKQFTSALSQAMFYVGAESIVDFQNKAEIRVL